MKLSLDRAVFFIATLKTKSTFCMLCAVMAGEMGISLGKFNYCLTELVKKGFVKMDRFRSSANKAAYMYILTPRGLEEKARVTTRFLHRKLAEFEEIKKQIEELAGEIGNPDLDAIKNNKGSEE